MTERISFGVLLENKGYNKSAVALAGDPQTEESLLYLQRSILPGGHYIEGPGQTIIGAGLADDLKLSVGDSLKVVSQASDGSLQLKKFRITGIFETGVSTLDGKVFQIPILDAKAFLRTGEGPSPSSSCWTTITTRRKRPRRSAAFFMTQASR